MIVIYLIYYAILTIQEVLVGRTNSNSLACIAIHTHNVAKRVAGGSSSFKGRHQCEAREIAS